MAIDEKLFGLVTVAEEQQAAVAKAIQALTAERAALAAERAAIPKTIAAAIASEIKASKDELTDACDSVKSAASAVSWKMVSIVLLSAAAISASLYGVMQYQMSTIAQYSETIGHLKADAGNTGWSTCGNFRCYKGFPAQGYNGYVYVTP